MFAASGFLREELVWPSGPAMAATKLWMDTFSAEPIADRVAKALVK